MSKLPPVRFVSSPMTRPISFLVEGDELAALIEVVLADTGASTKKDMGRVMGELTKRTGGNFDKAGAAKILGGKLS